jgi:hypothetical protein
LVASLANIFVECIHETAFFGITEHGEFFLSDLIPDKSVSKSLLSRGAVSDGLVALIFKSLLDVTKEFRSKLVTTQKELEQDFNDDEIDDQLGDVDFMNDFAEQLYDALDRLRQQCVLVINDCKARK